MKLYSSKDEAVELRKILNISKEIAENIKDAI